MDLKIKKHKYFNGEKIEIKHKTLRIIKKKIKELSFQNCCKKKKEEYLKNFKNRNF